MNLNFFSSSKQKLRLDTSESVAASALKIAPRAVNMYSRKSLDKIPDVRARNHISLFVVYLIEHSINIHCFHAEGANTAECSAGL